MRGQMPAFVRFPNLGQIPLAGLQPMGQVEFKPEINVPISLELGALPLSLGLFAGSGVSFLVGAQAPGTKPWSTYAGIALAGLGVANLVFGGRGEAAASAAAPSPAGPGIEVGPPLAVSPPDMVGLVEGSIVSPADYSTIDVSVLGAEPVPVRVRLHNPSGVQVSFDLVLDITEEPAWIPFGQRGAAITSQRLVRVSMGPGEVRDVDIAMQSASPSLGVEFVDVIVEARKKPLGGGLSQLLDSVAFVLE